MKFSPAALLLYGIPSATYQTADALLQDVRAAVAGGVTCIQIRIKHVPTQELVALAAPTVQFCKQQHIPCIINDDAEAAALLQADGVHVGQSDCSIQQARAILGKSACIGVSAHNLEEARMAQQGGADYIGCGPFRFTTTKKNLSPILGLDGYRNIVATMKQEHIELPIVAIGGITCDDIPAIMQTGVSGIALSGTILRADSPAEETHRILEEIRKYRTYK